MGYEKLDVPVDNMNIVGIQFQGIGADGVIDIQQITTEEWNGEGADWIKIYNPETGRYTTLYYWGADSDTYQNSLGAGWGDDAQIAVDIDIQVGQGFWVQSEAGGKLVFPTIPAN